MKRILLIIIALTSVSVTFAGNPDRIGESGSRALLMNGWARSTGLWDSYTARVTGVESMRLNPAGLAHIGKLEAVFAQTLWLQGSGVQLSQGGFAQRVGDKTVFGVSIMSISVGDLDRTTVAQPDFNNGLGTFSPTNINLGIGVSRSFSDRIFGGINVRLISESVENVRAFGFAFDAGIQYLLGKKKNLRFGVSIRNLGTPMTFRGDGFTFSGSEPDDGDYDLTLSQNTAGYELPAQLTLGASYDFWLGPEFRCNGAYNLHRLTLSGQFTSNSFGKDNFGGGVEYAFKEMFMIRGGYRHEQGLFNPDERTDAHIGFAGGFSVAVPFKPNGPGMGIDYSYRPSDPFGGTHSIGLRFMIGDGSECGEISAVEGKDAFKDEQVKEGKAIKLSKKEEKEISRISSAIKFETGSADLTASSKSELDVLADFLEKKENAKIKIGAHTDNVGTEDSNNELSERRANAVKDYLTKEGEISEDRIETEAFGESQPIDDNSTEEGKANNRRVELSIY